MHHETKQHNGASVVFRLWTSGKRMKLVAICAFALVVLFSVSAHLAGDEAASTAEQVLDHGPLLAPITVVGPKGELATQPTDVRSGQDALAPESDARPADGPQHLLDHGPEIAPITVVGPKNRLADAAPSPGRSGELQAARSVAAA